jgi:hypothetical protein
MRELWEALDIEDQFPQIHHFNSPASKSPPSSLSAFYRHCSTRRKIGEANLATIQRGLHVVDLINSGAPVHRALEAAWDAYPLQSSSEPTGLGPVTVGASSSKSSAGGVDLYHPRPHRDREIESARHAMEGIVSLDILHRHKKELLSVCIWKITEADGKWNVRYWSAGAVESDKRNWTHEHVYARSLLADRLLEGEDSQRVVADAVACIVTREEHAALGRVEGSGWERYRRAGLHVFDAVNGRWLEL